MATSKAVIKARKQRRQQVRNLKKGSGGSKRKPRH